MSDSFQLVNHSFEINGLWHKFPILPQLLKNFAHSVPKEKIYSVPNDQIFTSIV